MMSNFFFSLQSTIAYLGFHQGQSPNKVTLSLIHFIKISVESSERPGQAIMSHNCNLVNSFSRTVYHRNAAKFEVVKNQFNYNILFTHLLFFFTFSVLKELLFSKLKE